MQISRWKGILSSVLLFSLGTTAKADESRPSRCGGIESIRDGEWKSYRVSPPRESRAEVYNALIVKFSDGKEYSLGKVKGGDTASGESNASLAILRWAEMVMSRPEELEFCIYTAFGLTDDSTAIHRAGIRRKR